MLPVILVFYSLADAQAVEQLVSIPCGQDIDATINNTNDYPRSTPQRFVLGADCTFTASATIVPSDGDVVACASQRRLCRAARHRIPRLIAPLRVIAAWRTCSGP